MKKLRRIGFVVLSSLASCCALPAGVRAQTGAPNAAHGNPSPPAVTSIKQPTVSDDAAGVAGWKRYAFDDLGFSAAFPAPPRGGSTPNPGFGKSDAYNHVLVAGSDDGLYMIFCITGLPFAVERLAPAERDAIYRAAWRDLTKTIAAELEKSGSRARVTPGEERAATLGGVEGREQDLKYGLMRARARAALLNNRMYVVVTVHNASALAKNRNAFFDSFRLARTR